MYYEWFKNGEQQARQGERNESVDNVDGRLAKQKNTMFYVQ